MIFTDHFFLLYFFPTFCTLYLTTYLLFRSNFISNTVIILGSLLFYASFGIDNISILLVPLCIDFLLGIGIEKSKNQTSRKILFVLGLCINIALLGYFKYSHFLTEQIIPFFPTEALKEFMEKSIIMPVGISFITFQRISYLTDIFRKKTKAERNILHYAVYALIFPHLIAGPIVRYVEIKNELKKRIFTHGNFYIGIKLFAIGLFLKIVVADQLFLVEEHLIPILENLDALLSLILVFSFSLRLYFDFLGYSLMAIGIASILGFHFPDNFNSPYTSTSITDFWRRWNITLSNWVRDYVYIPLGGNRKGEVRACVNLMLAMLFAGLWHGAGWNFIIWGGLHGFFMVIERIGRKTAIKMPYRMSQIATFSLVSFLWVVFHFANIKDVRMIFSNIGQLTFFDVPILTHNIIMAILPAYIIALFWIVAIKERNLRHDHPTFAKLIIFSCLLFVTILFSLTRRTIGFIYFQF